jgi:hypothetical protein
MATYVNDLRLKEITTGDESGTWGTSTNTNLELIAEAFSYGTEVITTNADTHTTTIADGATDPGRSLYLKYTGTLDSACTITIGPNTVSKVWIVENGTSGSQDIILSQGSGANITIPAGDTKVVYSDGAGAGAAFFDAFASLSVVDLKVQDDLTVTDDLIVNGDIDLEGNMDVNGSLETDALSLNGTTVTSTAAEINLLDGSSANTVVNSKAVIYGSSGEVAGTLSTAAQPNITSVGTLTGFTSTGIDDNATSTAITIDSSQNVMVGTTDTFVADNSSGNGLSYRGSAGDLSVAASNTPAFYANRMGSDGTIADFRKDGTTVGSIVAGSGELIIGKEDTGLRFYDFGDAILPRTTANGVSNGATDLGEGSNRFKNLYLSGGVYLGGIGAANLLDDYEEGTFTPTVASGTGAFSTTPEGVYVKVGNIVHVKAVFQVSTNFSSNGISGLPFTVADDISQSSLGWNGTVVCETTGINCSASEASTDIFFFNEGDQGTAHNPNTTGLLYRVSVTYKST